MPTNAYTNAQLPIRIRWHYYILSPLQSSFLYLFFGVGVIFVLFFGTAPSTMGPCSDTDFLK